MFVYTVILLLRACMRSCLRDYFVAFTVMVADLVGRETGLEAIRVDVGVSEVSGANSVAFPVGKTRTRQVLLRGWQFWSWSASGSFRGRRGALGIIDDFRWSRFQLRRCNQRTLKWRFWGNVRLGFQG